jgi:hypothetical protein
MGDVLDVLLAILQTVFSKGFQLLSHTSATPPELASLEIGLDYFASKRL